MQTVIVGTAGLLFESHGLRQAQLIGQPRRFDAAARRDVASAVSEQSLGGLDVVFAERYSHLGPAGRRELAPILQPQPGLRVGKLLGGDRPGEHEFPYRGRTVRLVRRERGRKIAPHHVAQDRERGIGRREGQREAGDGFAQRPVVPHRFLCVGRPNHAPRLPAHARRLTGLSGLLQSVGIRHEL